MSAPDPDAAARVIERLLGDAAFRAQFRRDPAGACRAAGLDEVADEMSIGAGNAMHTLDIRESRSSLAGVMMAAALEGVGILEFSEQVVPRLAAAPGLVQDVLSRVNLPAVDGLRGSLAGSPAPAPTAAAAEAEPVVAPAAPAPPAPATPDPPADADSAADTEPEPEAAPAAAAAADEAAQEEPATEATAPPPAEPAAAAPAAPIDPASFGMEGSGDPPSPETLALLDNKNVVFDQDGVADLKAGRIDPRVVAVLTKLSEEHKIQVSCMCSDHARNTTGGSVSNHFYGRGVDIAAVDGAPVNAGNPMARDVATELGKLDPAYQPTEIGTPWAINDPKYFTDSGHADHLHVGFDTAIDASWKPPADVAAGGGVAAAPVAPETPETPGAPGAPAPGGRGPGTLSLPVPGGGGARAGPSRDSLSIRVPTSAVPAAPLERAAAPVAGAAADTVPAAGGGEQAAAGPRALAAVEEAMKYKGMPYLWGGSTPETGFDCSGLLQWAYAKQGIQIPRVTFDQVEVGKPVQREDLVPGDLIYFGDSPDTVGHAGIYIGGDRFLHAPHTGDVVKVSSLEEPYYAKEFFVGRRVDDAPPQAAAAPDPAAVEAAQAAHARDAAEAQRPGTLVFKALNRQEAINHSSTVQFMRAIRPEEAPAYKRAAQPTEAAEPGGRPPAGSLEYPGDGAGKAEIAAWLAAHAERAGLPPELPVMASLVESGLRNLNYGDADSVGFFQMRVGIWNKGEYAGYPERPELQAKWFIDHALAHKRARIAAGDADFGQDPSRWGEWIADVERPAAQYRGRYQPQLAEARRLLRRRS